MISKFMVRSLLAASALTLVAGTAHANVYNLNLTGSVASATPYDFHIGSTRYQGQFIFPLAGIDNSNAITVQQGDTINTTVTLDQLWNIPGSVYLTDVTLYLTSVPFSGVENNTTDTTLFAGGTQVATQTGSLGTGGQVAGSIDLFPPNNGPISFDSGTFSEVITFLGSPQLINEAQIAYQLQGPFTGVPEPTTWAMMLLGLGGLGAAMRSRRRIAVAA